MINTSDTKIARINKVTGDYNIMAKISSKTTTNDVETAVESVVVTPSVKFVESQDILGSMKAVIFTPDGYNGRYRNIDLFDSMSAFTAIKEVLGKTVESGGDKLHVRSTSYSLYDGVKSFYVGGAIIREAIEDGLTMLPIAVAGKTYKVSLPKSTNFIGEWTKVNTRLGEWARAVPCSDTNHMINQDKKHNILEIILSGTKLAIYCEPTMVQGELKSRYSDAAKELRAAILNEDGTLRTAEEIATGYFESKRQYVGQNKLEKQAEKMAKVQPVLQQGVAVSILVDGEDTELEMVPHGRYIKVSKDGKQEPWTHVNNLVSHNTLQLIANRGDNLLLQRKF